MRRLIEEIVGQLAEDGLELDARDRALLDTAARLADRMADLDALVAEDGSVRRRPPGLCGCTRQIAEHRQYAVALGKVLSGISLHVSSGKDPAKQRAAQTRRRAHNAAKAAKAGA